MGNTQAPRVATAPFGGRWHLPTGTVNGKTRGSTWRP